MFGRWIGLLLAAAPALAAQDTRVTIRGRVFNPDSTPISGARVIATRVGETTSDTVVTKPNGLYVLVLDTNQPYLVAAFAINRVPAQRTVTATGNGDIVDFYLPRAPVVLGPVRVTASNRRKPGRQTSTWVDASTTDRGFSGATWITGARDFDIASAASTAPGVVPVDNGTGFSVLGLAAAENSVALNGMDVQLANLPRDITAYTNVGTSPLDPARGGFSGGQVSLLTPAGSDVVRRSAHISTRQSPSVRPTANAAVYAPKSQDYQLSASASGPIVRQRAYYTTSLQLGHAQSPAIAFDELASDFPSSLRIAWDTAAAALSALGRAGLPLAARVGDDRSDNVSAFARSDVIVNQNARLDAVSWVNRWSSTTSDGSPTALASTGAHVRRSGVGGQLGLSQYLGGVVLHEPRLSISAASSAADALSAFPAVVINARSVIDSQIWNTPISAGGNPLTSSGVSGATYQLRDDATWLAGNNRHRITVSVASELQSDRERAGRATNGSFQFTTLSSFRDGQPSSFFRGSAATSPTATTENSYLALGDYWQPNTRTRIEIGARLDRGSVLAGAPNDTANLRALGLSATTPAASWTVSPRVGGSFSYGKRSRLESPSGEPKGSVRFALGRYAGAWRPNVFARAALETATTLGDLTCIGDAAPAPAWSLYAANPDSVPSGCLGSAISRTRDASVFARDFRPSSSWRAAAGSTRYLPDGSRFDLDIVLSRTTNLRSVRDANVPSLQSFSLANEGGRPVYAPAAAIDTTSGLMAPASGRVIPTVARVIEQSSVARSRGAAVTASFSPMSTTRFGARIAYTASWVRDLMSGFDASTAGDPRALEWQANAVAPRHQVITSLAMGLGSAVHASLYSRTQSGTAYTPLVNADVNGDHAANDRAFVFDPARVADTTLRSAMARLLASPQGACLRRQAGAVARAGSCTGAWSTSLNANIRLDPAALRFSDRMSAELVLIDMPAGLDYLLHGTHAHGWGTPSNPDPSLLQVTGFDPATSRYRYAVNPGFGRAFARPGSFALTLHLRVELGPDPDRQVLEQQLSDLAAIPGEPDTLRLRAALTQYVPNVALYVVAVRDSLGLSREQVAALRALSAAYQARANAIWSPFVDWLTRQRLDYADERTVRRFKDTKLSAYRNAAALGSQVKDLLTPTQIASLSGAVRSYFDYDAVVEMRNRY